MRFQASGERKTRFLTQSSFLLLLLLLFRKELYKDFSNILLLFSTEIKIGL